MKAKSDPNSRDLTLRCCDCNGNFLWTYGEQKYYADRNLSIPRRCPQCRARRRKRTSPFSLVPPGDYTTVHDCRS